jgi:SNARE protein 1
MTELTKLLSSYDQQLEDLGLPSFYTPASSYTPPATSPVVTRLKLDKLADELASIRATTQDARTLAAIQSAIDEKVFVNNQLLELWRAHNRPPLPPAPAAVVAGDDDDVENLNASVARADDGAGDNTSSLRRRLLADSGHSVLDKSNDYHESIQEDILQELTGFALSLKDSALKLSSKIVEDTTVLERTNEMLLKNSNLMGQIDKNLNSYVLNKTGGKIGFWFLLKVLAAVFVTFFLMVALIKIFPKF